MRAVITVCSFVVAIAPAVAADPLVSLSGRVTDAKTEQPIEGAVVHAVAAGHKSVMRTTDRAGRYLLELPPAAYAVTFIAGASRTTKHLKLVAEVDMVADAALASNAEVIEIEGTLAEPRAPKAKNFVWTRVPRYTDEAILKDVWARAWLLLSIDDTGEVTKFKFLKRPGYGLDDIAAEEAFRLKFAPATDADGKAVSARVIWPIEWPANSFMLEKYEVQRMPGVEGFPAHSAADYVPCAGLEYLNLESLYRVFRDCSQPDLSKAAGEAWILPTDE
jgi:hypothetical protein